jgi:hypothetical protein
MIMAHHAATVFDTLQYAKRLQKAGFTEVQAEAQVGIIKEQVDAISSLIDGSLATKTDMKHLEERINDRMASLEERLNDRIVRMGYKIIISLGSMIAAAVGVLGVLIRLH